MKSNKKKIDQALTIQSEIVKHIFKGVLILGVVANFTTTSFANVERQPEHTARPKKPTTEELKCYSAAQNVVDSMGKLAKDNNKLQLLLKNTPYKSIISDFTVETVMVETNYFNLNQAKSYKELLNSKVKESKLKECVKEFNKTNSDILEMDEQINQMSKRVVFFNKNKETYKKLYACKDEKECNTLLAFLFVSSVENKKGEPISVDTAELEVLNKITTIKENNSKEATQCSLLAKEVKVKVIENKKALDDFIKTVPENLTFKDVFGKFTLLIKDYSTVNTNREIFFLDKLIEKQIKVGEEKKCLQVLDLMSKQGDINKESVEAKVKGLPNLVDKIEEIKSKTKCKDFSSSSVDCRNYELDIVSVILEFFTGNKESKSIGKKMIELDR